MKNAQMNLHFTDGDALRAHQFDGFVTVSLDSDVSISMFFRTIAHAKGVLEAGLTALAALEEPVVEDATEAVPQGRACERSGNGDACGDDGVPLCSQVRDCNGKCLDCQFTKAAAGEHILFNSHMPRTITSSGKCGRNDQ